MNKKRDVATSLTTTVFLVIGITGVMMYFHILDKYTKDMHEILGLAFVAIVFFHVLFNWKSMRKYFSKKVFLLSAFTTLLVVLGFIYSASTSQQGKDPKRLMINAVFKAQIEDSVNILGSNMETFQLKLETKGIKFNNEETILQIAKNNNISPFKIVSIISK